MASIGSPIESIPPDKSEFKNLQITDCGRCRNAVTEPRLLPCAHTFCLICLEDWAMDKLPGDEAECPLCDKPFLIPERGPSGLPKNRFIDKLNRSKAQEKSSSQGCPCDRCSRNKKKNNAVSFCTDCMENLCNSCCNLHLKFKATCTHNCIELRGNPKAACGGRLDTRAPSPCDRHPNKTIELLCEECREVVCTACYAEFHNAHKCSDVEKAAEGLRLSIDNDRDNVSRGIVICRGELFCLDSDQRAFNDRIVAVKREIDAEAERVKRKVDQHAQRALLKLDLIQKERVKQIASKVNMVESRVNQLEDLNRYLDEIVKMGSSSDIVQQADALRGRSVELLTFNSIERSLRQLGCVQLDFIPSHMVTEDSDNVVGSVDVCMMMGGIINCFCFFLFV